MPRGAGRKEAGRCVLSGTGVIQFTGRASDSDAHSASLTATITSSECRPVRIVNSISFFFVMVARMYLLNLLPRQSSLLPFEMVKRRPQRGLRSSFPP